MTATLIVTTYNRPDALALVLRSAMDQQRPPNEIVVADDGSSAETRQKVQALAMNSPIPIRHVWQEDRGFRAAMVRNRAVAASSGEYLIFTDGDMVLHPAFVADHLRFAQKGFFLQGGRVLLDSTTTQKVLKEGRIRFNPLYPGLGNRFNAWHMPLFCRFFARPNHSLRGIRTCNFSLLRSDFLAVNGFDNRFVGWGREDSELVLRLYHYGLKRKNLKMCAIAYHLHHHEYDRAALPENDRRLEATRNSRKIRCEEGIDRFLKEGASQ